MATNRSKRYRAAAEKVDAKKTYSLDEAVSVLKSLPPTKFDQTVTLSFRRGVEFKLDKNGNVAVPVGKFSFDAKALSENGAAVIDAVVKARPATAKGVFVENVTLAATMLPGLRVDAAPFLKS